MSLALEVFKDRTEKIYARTDVRVVDPGKRLHDKMNNFSKFLFFSIFQVLVKRPMRHFLRIWGARLEIQRPKFTLTYIHTSFTHSPYICCPELMWSLILARVCGHGSETTGVGGLCLLAGLIKTSYSSALYCGDYASGGSTCQRIMVSEKNNQYISWLTKFALRNIQTV